MVLRNLLQQTGLMPGIERNLVSTKSQKFSTHKEKKEKKKKPGQNKALGTNLLYRHTSSLEKGGVTDRSEEERTEVGHPEPAWIVPG